MIMRARDLHTSGAEWIYRPSRHKTMHRGRNRVIYLGSRAQANLKPFLFLDTRAFLFSPARDRDERLAERRAKRQTKLFSSGQKRTNPDTATAPDFRIFSKSDRRRHFATSAAPFSRASLVRLL